MPCGVERWKGVGGQKSCPLLIQPDGTIFRFAEFGLLWASTTLDLQNVVNTQSLWRNLSRACFRYRKPTGFATRDQGGLLRGAVSKVVQWLGSFALRQMALLGRACFLVFSVAR